MRPKRITPEKGVGAEQARLLPISKQDHHITRMGTRRLQKAHGFEHGGYAGDVISGAGRIWYAVIVGHQKNCGEAAVSSSQKADHISDRSRRHIAGLKFRLIQAHSGMHLGSQT